MVPRRRWGWFNKDDVNAYGVTVLSDEPTLSDRTLKEMQAGRIAVAKARLNDADWFQSLRKMAGGLPMSTMLGPDLTVTLKVTTKDGILEFTDSLREFPSETLAAQLALIAP